jgi:hypothetical protein
MATVTVTGTPVTLDTTGAAELGVTNTGSVAVFVNSQRVRPGQRLVFDARQPLAVATQGGAGTSTVDTDVASPARSGGSAASPGMYPVPGATGTAATDFANIQGQIDAAAAAGGGIVQLPAGGFRTSAPIRPRSNVTLRGAGDATTITLTINGHTIASDATPLSNFRVEDLKLVGPVNQTVTVPTRGRTTSGPGADVAIWIDGDLNTSTDDPPPGGRPVISNVSVHNVTVEGSTWLPVRLAGIRGKVAVTESLFYNTMDVGFIFCEEVICANNTSIMSADNGFSISRGNRKVTCTGNTVENAAFAGIWLSGFIGSTGPDDFTCTGNTVRGCGQQGIALMDAPVYGTIVGNTIDKMFYRGYAETQDDTTCCGIFIRGVSNNTTTPGTFTRALLIADNTIRSSPRAGIYVNGASGLKISNNLIVDTGTQYAANGTSLITASFTSTNIGIMFDVPATVTTCTVNSNTIIDTRGTPYLNWGIYPTAVASVTMSGNNTIGARNTTTLQPTVRADFLGLLSVGQETMPRWAATQMATLTMPSGAVRIAYFIASRNETVANLSMSTGNTAAAATPTLVRFGLYSVAANGDLTQIAATVSDATIFATTLTRYARALSAPVTLVEGQQYAVAALVVTAAAAPSVTGVLCATPVDNGLMTPRLCHVVTGQADLAATYAQASLAQSQSFVYAAVTP